MNRHRFSKEEILNCRRSLLTWYDANKRKLPWRDWHDIDTNIVAYRGLKKKEENCDRKKEEVFSFSFGINASTNSSSYCYSIL
jgi:adenine-specific DNA glycosylase